MILSNAWNWLFRRNKPTRQFPAGTVSWVVDTNVFLRNLSVLEDKSVVVSSHVLREIENHTKSQNSELAWQARRAKRWIRKHKKMVTIDLKDYGFTLNQEFDPMYVDNKLIQMCYENGYGLMTYDVVLMFKAEAFDIPLFELDEDVVDGQFGKYDGWKAVTMTKQDFDSIYQNLSYNRYKLLVNQYLLAYDKYNGKHLGTLRWTGESHVSLNLPSKNKVQGKNELQDVAIDLLWNKDIPIKIIAGTYGSGKTFLAVKAGIDFIKSRNDGYDKLMVVRNPIGTGEAIGFLKGDKDAKTADFFKPIIQHLEGGQMEADQLEQWGKLVKEIPYYMKGLSIDNTFILVDEAEDLDKKLIKLLGTRLGQNACIVFSGDVQQAEDKFTGRNGLAYAIEKLRGNPLVGIVILTDDVRSDASKVFADL